MKASMIECILTNDSLQTKRFDLHGSCFEKHMQGQAYYQDHKSQWEQNALQFEQLSSQHSQRDSAERCENAKATQRQNAGVFQYIMTKANEGDENTLVTAQEKAAPCPCDLQQIDTSASCKKLPYYLAPQTSLKWVNEQLLCRPELKQYSNLQRLLPLNNHQLFIADGFARLAIQDYSQPAKVMRLLLKAVKNVLASRGITLIESRINGACI